MTALLSLTNSSSSQSNTTGLPFRPQREWPHFSREHSSMSTESFQNCSSEFCNGGDEGRKVLLKISPSLLHLDSSEIWTLVWLGEQPRELSPAKDWD